MRAAKRQGKAGITKIHRETDRIAESPGEIDSAKSGQDNIRDASIVGRSDKSEING